MKNPHEILEVSKDADEKTIKKAYRKAAMKWHPDVNDNSEESKVKFNEIQEAYEKLTSDSASTGGYSKEKRERYWTWEKQNIEDLIKNHFNRDRMHFNHLHVKHKIHVDIERLCDDEEITTVVPIQHKCPDCKGFPPIFKQDDPCVKCDNTGKIPEYKKVSFKLNILENMYRDLKTVDGNLNFKVRLKNIGKKESVDDSSSGINFDVTGDVILSVFSKLPDGVKVKADGSVVHEIRMEFHEVLEFKKLELTTFYGKKYRVRTSQFEYFDDMTVKIRKAGVKNADYVFKIKTKIPKISSSLIKKLSKHVN